MELLLLHVETMRNRSQTLVHVWSEQWRQHSTVELVKTLNPWPKPKHASGQGSSRENAPQDVKNIFIYRNGVHNYLG